VRDELVSGLLQQAKRAKTILSTEDIEAFIKHTVVAGGDVNA